MKVEDGVQIQTKYTNLVNDRFLSYSQNLMAMAGAEKWQENSNFMVKFLKTRKKTNVFETYIEGTSTLYKSSSTIFLAQLWTLAGKLKGHDLVKTWQKCAWLTQKPVLACMYAKIA